jgi:hypothetical protein
MFTWTPFAFFRPRNLHKTKGAGWNKQRASAEISNPRLLCWSLYVTLSKNLYAKHDCVEISLKHVDGKLRMGNYRSSKILEMQYTVHKNTYCTTLALVAYNIFSNLTRHGHISSNGFFHNIYIHMCQSINKLINQTIDNKQNKSANFSYIGKAVFCINSYIILVRVHSH